MVVAAGLTAATTAGFGVGVGVAIGATTGAGLGAIGVVIRCWACVRRIGEPTVNAPEGLNVTVGRIAAPANGTAGFARITATGTGRGRLGAPGNTGGNGWARGTTIVACVIRGGCATAVWVLRTGGAVIVGVGAGAALIVTLLGGRCKLEPAAAVRGNGANGLSARGVAAGRGLVWAGCALVVAVFAVVGFVAFGLGVVAVFGGFFNRGTPLLCAFSEGTAGVTGVLEVSGVVGVVLVLGESGVVVTDTGTVSGELGASGVVGVVLMAGVSSDVSLNP